MAKIITEEMFDEIAKEVYALIQGGMSLYEAGNKIADYVDEYGYTYSKMAHAHGCTGVWELCEYGARLMGHTGGLAYRMG